MLFYNYSVTTVKFVGIALAPKVFSHVALAFLTNVPVPLTLLTQLNKA